MVFRSVSKQICVLLLVPLGGTFDVGIIAILNGNDFAFITANHGAGGDSIALSINGLSQQLG